MSWQATQTIFALLALAAFGTVLGQAAAAPQEPVAKEAIVWPTQVCDPSDPASTTGNAWADWRPRILDEVGPTPPEHLLMPVEGALVADVYPSYGDPRGGGRLHIGIDIMAPRGTPVRPAAPGYVLRTTDADRGGISVSIVGDGGVRYFYTHFDSLPAGLEVGQYVDLDTVIGYVGNTGNAAATAPHLHFEVHVSGSGEWCGWSPVDPLPLLSDRLVGGE